MSTSPRVTGAAQEHACPSCRCANAAPGEPAAQAAAPGGARPWRRPSDWLHLLGRCVALPAAALAVYGAVSWLAHADLDAQGARADGLPPIAADAARGEERSAAGAAPPAGGSQAETPPSTVRASVVLR
jgi:hypothetical protein